MDATNTTAQLEATITDETGARVGLYLSDGAHGWTWTTEDGTEIGVGGYAWREAALRALVQHYGAPEWDLDLVALAAVESNQ